MRFAARDLLLMAALAPSVASAIACSSEAGSNEPAPMSAAGLGGMEPDFGMPAPPDAGPFTSLADRTCPEGELGELSYESFGAPFFLSYCQGCHGSARADGQRQGAAPAVAFDDVAAIRQHAARIWARAADQNATMPPEGGPPVHERQKLGAWLSCGAKTRAEL